MPTLPLTRLTLGVVGLLLCSLPLTGTSLVGSGGTPTGAEADLQLASRSCGGFGPRDVLRGRAPRHGRTCKPIGLDAGIIHAPIALARKRDRHNYLRAGVHRKRRHFGTDFRAPCGTPVYAAHGGKVVIAKMPHARRVTGVSMGPGRLTTWYGHLSGRTARNGSAIGAGRRLGRVTRPPGGRCHLHFGVHLRGGKSDPDHVNPSRWLRSHRGLHVSGLAPGKRDEGTFIAASFNVLGDRHTAPGGSKSRRFAGSHWRMARTVSLLRSNHVGLVGFQELQETQRKAFLRMTRHWRIFSPRDPQDSIAWHSSRFTLVRADSFVIPYFGPWRPMPVVVLRDRATGRKFAVVSVHNPADRSHPRKMKHRRSEAVRRELKMVSTLLRTTRAPVILMGDFNDRSRRFFCRIARAGLKASSGGVRGRHCRPNQVAGVDWILGTRRIRFTGHQRVHGGLVARATDHPLVLARVKR